MFECLNNRIGLCPLSFVLCLALLVGCSEGPMGGAKEPKFRFAPISRADVVRTVEATQGDVRECLCHAVG